MILALSQHLPVRNKTPAVFRVTANAVDLSLGLALVRDTLTPLKAYY